MAAAGAREPRDLRGGQTQGTMPQGAKAGAVSHWSWATVSLPWGEEGTEPGCCGARTLPPLGQTERRHLYPSEAAASQPPACEITGPQDLLPWGQPPPAAPTHPGTRLSWESSGEPAPCWGAAASPNPPLTPNVAREVQELSGDHTGGAKPLDLQTSLPLRPPMVGHHPKSPPNSRRTRCGGRSPAKAPGGHQSGVSGPGQPAAVTQRREGKFRLTPALRSPPTSFLAPFGSCNSPAASWGPPGATGPPPCRHQEPHSRGRILRSAPALALAHANGHSNGCLHVGARESLVPSPRGHREPRRAHGAPWVLSWVPVVGSIPLQAQGWFMGTGRGGSAGWL